MHLPDLWNLIRADIASARSTLPPDAASDHLVLACQEYLDHNELELACDTLAAYAEDHVVTPAFWTALAAAADKMQLPETALEFRRRAAS